MSRGALLTLVLMSVVTLAAMGEGKVDVLCIYYPEWHVYPEGERIFGRGRTEWDFVRTAAPRFDGHCQPIGLAAGEPDDANPADVAREIDAAADAGIDAFVYDWYWAEGRPIQHEALEHGFLAAANRDRMRFALMWANHDRSDAFRPVRGKAGARYHWRLAWTREEFLSAMDYCIRTYFGSPRYYLKGGKPFFSVYSAGKLLRRVGGAAKMRAILSEAQARARAAGLPPIHFSAMIHGVEEAEEVAAAGYESMSVYNITPDEFDDNEVDRASREAETRLYAFEEFADLQRTVNGALASAGSLPYIPVACRGWDTSPRCRLDEPFPWKTAEYPYMSIVHGFGEKGFARLLADVRRQAEGDPRTPGAVIINGWNEYTEGCYLMPDKWTGNAALRAVKTVFGGESRLPEGRRPTPPSDFWAYWQGERARLRREIPVSARRTLLADRSTNLWNVYSISFATFGGKRLHGYMSVPKVRTERLPVYFGVPGAGPGVDDCGRRAKGISAFVNVHGYEQPEKAKMDARFEEWKRDLLARWKGIGHFAHTGLTGNRDDYFYHDVILGLDRAVDWLAQLPEANGDVRYSGTSQGGGLGLALAALNPRVTRLVAHVPALTDLLGGEAGRTSGWPRLPEGARTAALAAAVEKVAPYYDAVNFAAFVTCPTRLSVGVKDAVVPHTAVRLAFEALAAKDKELLVGEDMTHSVYREFYASTDAWLERD